MDVPANLRDDVSEGVDLMPTRIKHAFESTKADGPDSTFVKPSDWNAEHVLEATGDAGFVLGRDTSGDGPIQELPIAVTPAGDLSLPASHGATRGAAGTTAQRPAPGVRGSWRWNGTLNVFEAFESNASGQWGPLVTFAAEPGVSITMPDGRAHIGIDLTYADGRYAPFSKGVAQVVDGQNNTYQTIAGTYTPIPLDGTTPQISEGALVYTVNFTAKKATSMVFIECPVHFFASGIGDQNIVMAVFKDGAANAVGTSVDWTFGDHVLCPFRFRLAAVTAAPQVYTFRMSVSGGFGFHINGDASARLFNGTMFSGPIIYEIGA